MNIKPIRTEQDYEAALRAVEPMFDNEPEMNTPEGDFFEVMCLLIEEYEKKHYPIEPPSPIEAIKFRMEQQGLTVKDLEPAIGKSNRVYRSAKWDTKFNVTYDSSFTFPVWHSS